MIKIKYNSKMQNIATTLLNYDDKGSLYDCYNRPSQAKERAFKYCEDLRDKYQDSTTRSYYGILSYNTSIFTYGFIGIYEGKKAVFYITPTSDFVSIIE